MKTTTNFLMLLSGIMLCYLTSTAQQINSSGYYPPVPTSSDTIVYYNYMLFYLEPCSMDSSSIRDSANYIYLDSYHCLGSATGVCLTNDSIRIPPHAPGSYFIVYNAHYDTLPCGNGYSGLLGSGFGVDVLTTGIQITEDCNVDIRYDRSTSNIRFITGSTCRKTASSFKVFDVGGRCILEREQLSLTETISWNASDGVYFFELEDQNGMLRKGKFLVQGQ